MGGRHAHDAVFMGDGGVLISNITEFGREFGGQRPYMHRESTTVLWPRDLLCLRISSASVQVLDLQNVSRKRPLVWIFCISYEFLILSYRTSLFICAVCMILEFFAKYVHARGLALAVMNSHPGGVHCKHYSIVEL